MSQGRMSAGSCFQLAAHESSAGVFVVMGTQTVLLGCGIQTGSDQAGLASVLPENMGILNRLDGNKGGSAISLVRRLVGFCLPAFSRAGVVYG